ncbi:MAG: ribosomal protein [Ignavibacteria bacterium]|nr:ribosomal protein [Ignavibacteria bacterium]
MKPRKMADLLDLTEQELFRLLAESKETLAKQKFQHALKQLQDTTYLKILRKDIARMNTIINNRKEALQNG